MVYYAGRLPKAASPSERKNALPFFALPERAAPKPPERPAVLMGL
jgi:hypothetical protein